MPTTWNVAVKLDLLKYFTCARMSFIASLESSSPFPRILSSLNIRTWNQTVQFNALASKGMGIQFEQDMLIMIKLSRNKSFLAEKKRDTLIHKQDSYTREDLR